MKASITMFVECSRDFRGILFSRKELALWYYDTLGARN